MARTHHHGRYGRRNRWNLVRSWGHWNLGLHRENASIRKGWNRKQRAEAKQRVREERYDAIERWRGTGGWLTW